MTNSEKLEALKAFLKENGIVFYNEFRTKKLAVMPDLYIPKHKIMVKLSDENDQKFFNAVKFRYHPLFIRDNETSEFIIEKMQNLIIDIMNFKQRLYQKMVSKKQK